MDLPALEPHQTNLPSMSRDLYEFDKFLLGWISNSDDDNLSNRVGGTEHLQEYDTLTREPTRTDSQQISKDLCEYCQILTVENLSTGYKHSQKKMGCPLCYLLISCSAKPILRVEQPMLPGLPPMLYQRPGTAWNPIFIMTKEGMLHA